MENEVSLDELYFHTSQKDCRTKYNVNLHSKMNHLTVVQTFLAEIVDLVQMIEHFLRPAFIPMTIL